MRLLLLLVLAAGNVALRPVKFVSVSADQVLLTVPAPGVGRYRACADIAKRQGPWRARFEVRDHLGRPREHLPFEVGREVVLECRDLLLKPRDSVRLVSATAFKSVVTVRLTLNEENE